MRIRIYQIDYKLDKNNLLFRSLSYIKEASGGIVPSEVYRFVYEGEVATNSLEDIYTLFNVNHPHDYKGRSLSVSDVVEIMHDNESSSFHMCDTFGFGRIDFDSSKAAGMHSGDYTGHCSVRKITRSGIPPVK